ncbi:hypothetical protein [Ferrimicrobium sp.]|uniref:hypothetical protein n=1 Tax=Ferrimicrobium sp. TaxID=2926050 RepID=UPI00262DDA24|nr:hypothetical protein [Ferrimicrobium sp.]
MHLAINNPFYVVLLIFHVGIGLIGFGSNAMAGWTARDAAHLGPSESVRRFFDGRISLAQWCVILVPVFGISLLVLRDAADISQIWFLAAVTIWVITLGLLTARGWPAQRTLGALLASVPEVGAVAGSDAEIHSQGLIVLRTQQVVVVLYLVAFYLMLFKP